MEQQAPLILTILAVACAAAGAWTDLKTARIPNWLTYPSFVLGLASALALPSPAGVADHILGALFAGAVPMMFYLARLGVGGGDVKLLAAIGALRGLWFAYHAAMYAALTAVGLALLAWTARKSSAPAFHRLERWLSPAGLTRTSPAGKTKLLVPYGVAIFIGVLLAVLDIRLEMNSPLELVPPDVQVNPVEEP